MKDNISLDALIAYRDSILEEIEDLTVLIYENQCEISKLQEKIDTRENGDYSFL